MGRAAAVTDHNAHSRWRCRCYSDRGDGYSYFPACEMSDALTPFDCECFICSRCLGVVAPATVARLRTMETDEGWGTIPGFTNAGVRSMLLDKPTYHGKPVRWVQW